jgi:diguanylate cyclase (GGDEF)-like protein
VLDGNRESSVGPTLTAALKERAQLRAERGDYRGAYQDLAQHLAESDAANAEALHQQSAALRARLQFDRQNAQNAMLRAELANAAEHNDHRTRVLILSVVAAAAVIALLAGTLLMGRRHQRLLQRLVDTDALTGLPNRRAIHHAATTMPHRAPASVAMLDIDNFKRLNDRYGHAAGDAALTSFADAARGALRPDDLVGRWGGEEFVIVLAATDVVTAGGVIERLRSIVAKLVLPDMPDVRLSFSAGIAAWHPDRDELDAVLVAADAALYRAKEGGRDCTVIHREPPAGSSPASVPHAA